MAKPTNPNINFPQAFAIDGQKTDFLEEKIQDGFDPIDPDVLAGDNLNKFIDDTYKGLHYAMDGVNDLYKGAVLYSSTETYNSTSIVFSISEDRITLYRSLADNNLGNPLTDTTKWKLAAIGADQNLSNLTDAGEKHFLNKSQITNCILEAPNGVATYSGTTITLKQGLKVLIPNGRNADGTLNNIEYTVQQDMTLNVAVADKWNGIYGLKASGIIDTFSQSEPISIQDEQPSVNKGYWYSPKLNRNYFYQQSLSSWEEIKMVLLGKYTFNSNYTSITEFTTINTVDLLKRTDKPDVTSWGYPTNKKIELTIPNPNIPLTVPDNGYVQFHNESTSSILHGIVNRNGYVASYSNSTFFEGYVPVKKGDTVSVFYTELNDPYLRFIYAKGAQE